MWLWLSLLIHYFIQQSEGEVMWEVVLSLLLREDSEREYCDEARYVWLCLYVYYCDGHV